MKKFITISCLGLLAFACNQKPANEIDAPEEVIIDSTNSLTVPHSHEHSSEGPECMFNKDTVTDVFLKNEPEFVNYTWNNETKEARVILENKDSLYIHVGGCQHYGVSATLTRVGNKEKFTNHKYWISQALWIAERVKGFEPALLKDVDDHKNYDEESDAEGLFIDFHENDYSLIVDRKDGYTHITLNHYFH